MKYSDVSLRAWMLVVFTSSFAWAAATAPASAPTAPKIVGGPYLQAPSPTSMTLVWTTDKKCVSKVEYGRAISAGEGTGGTVSADEGTGGTGTGGTLPNVAVSARHGLIDVDVTLHRVTLRGLRPGTAYQYRVVSTEVVKFNPYRVKYGASVSAEGRFTTLDPRKERFSFLVVNDRHDRATELRQALRNVSWDAVDLVFGLGDVMNDPASEGQVFRNFLDPCVESFAGRIPLVFVRGNHETRGALARHLMDYFPTESGRYYYSFDHGGVHLLVLDGGEDKADTSREYSGLAAFEEYLKEETEWLRGELRSPAFRDARFRVCLLHIPPFADEPSRSEFIRAPWIRDHWSPMLSEAGLDLMLSGHTHRYAELPPTAKRTYPLVIGDTNTVIRVDASPEELRMTTFDDAGKVLSRPPTVKRKR